MARYKHYDLNQTKMIPLCYADQILPGSFEHALGEIVEQHLDLTAFDQRYHNDQTGRLAYDPKVLLKIVIYGYYKGLLSSRQLEEACQRNIIFMALSADTRPHFTTIASFVRELHREIVDLFRDVLLYASELGLIGSEHFAVDGCKLPSNASKQWSGTHAELEEKRKKLQGVAERIIQRHQDQDSAEDGAKASAGHAKKLEHYQRKMNQLETLLRDTDKKLGPTGNEQKTNLTDPQSAKMKSSRGIIQGYNGLAVVDDRAQIVVHAQAQGSGYEGHLLAPLLEQTRDCFSPLVGGRDILKQVKVTADSGFHSKAVVAAVEQIGADAYIADREYRRRQPTYAAAARHRERHNKERRLHRSKLRQAAPPAEKKQFTAEDFSYDLERMECVCPAGNKLYPAGKDMLFNGYRVARFKAPITACRNCPLRVKCLRKPDRTPQRQLTIIKHTEGPPQKAKPNKHAPTERMRFKFDSPSGRQLYAKRMGTVEPVFGNIQNKGMRRFTMRGQIKVNAQWQLFTIVHNIEKIARVRRQ